MGVTGHPSGKKVSRHPSEQPPRPLKVPLPPPFRMPMALHHETLVRPEVHWPDIVTASCSPSQANQPLTTHYSVHTIFSQSLALDPSSGRFQSTTRYPFDATLIPSLYLPGYIIRPSSWQTQLSRRRSRLYTRHPTQDLNRSIEHIPPQTKWRLTATSPPWGRMEQPTLRTASKLLTRTKNSSMSSRLGLEAV